MTYSKKNKTIYAKDCKCSKCGKQAVCFWPIVDIDIPDHPYCRKCVEAAKMRVLLELNKIENHVDTKLRTTKRKLPKRI